MKLLALSFPLVMAALLSPSAAGAARLDVPAISGTLYNPSGLAPSSIQLIARYRCQYEKQGAWGPAETFDCGKKTIAATLTSASADNRVLRFRFGAVSLGSTAPALRTSTFSGLVLARVGGRDVAARLSSFILGEGGAVSRFAGELRELTLLYLAPAWLRFVDAAGARAEAAVLRAFPSHGLSVSVSSNLSTDYESAMIYTNKPDALTKSSIRSFAQLQPGRVASLTLRRRVQAAGKQLSDVSMTVRPADLAGRYPARLTNIVVDASWRP